MFPEVVLFPFSTNLAHHILESSLVDGVILEIYR